MNNNPLVSIPVITYNSSSYIIEGLESVKAQTYKNIELIISDDCSIDNTVEICRKWLEENKQYFKRAVLVTAEKNTGVAGNLNRAIRECQGDWIKLLAGDDKFFTYTIAEYIKYVEQHPEFSVVEAQMHIIGNNIPKLKKAIQIYNNIYSQIRNRKNQYKRCLINCFFPGPPMFFKRALFYKIGGFDEKYQFCEEYPFSLRILKEEEFIPLIEQELIIYNIVDGSISHGDAPNLRNIKDNISFFRDDRSKELLKRLMILHWLDISSTYYAIESSLFYPNNKMRKILSIIYKMMSPLRIAKVILKKYHHIKKL